jgi:hypothetical protein
MRRVIRMCVLAAVVAAVPASAHAETYFNPWLGVFFGSDTPAIQSSDKPFTSFGAMVGDTGSITGFEATFGYTPDFYGKGTDSNVLDLMAGLTAGPQIGRGTVQLRPYGAGGAGLLRSSLAGSSSNDFGFNAGGGVFVWFSTHVGVRGDLRYFRTINGDDLGDFNFTRVHIGLLLR